MKRESWSMDAFQQLLLATEQGSRFFGGMQQVVSMLSAEQVALFYFLIFFPSKSGPGCGC